MVLAFSVPNELDGQRLDRFVQWRIPRLTRGRATEIVTACAYLADGSRRAPSDRVRAREVVLLVRERFVEPEVPRDFEQLYRDEWVMALSKPAGLPVHPSPTYHKNTLTSLLRERFGPQFPQICHRLDRETSGVIVCATPGPDEAQIKEQFAKRRVAKEYLAIVRGKPEHDSGVIELALRRTDADCPDGMSPVHLRMLVDPEGLPARTRYRVIARRHDRSLVHLAPKTGRQHQLRVHLAAIGHPILGDKLYGPDEGAGFLEHIETGMTPDLERRLGHSRHALHAFRCAIQHPRTQERIWFEAPLPPDLVQLWNDAPALPNETPLEDAIRHALES